MGLLLVMGLAGIISGNRESGYRSNRTYQAYTTYNAFDFQLPVHSYNFSEETPHDGIVNMVAAGDFPWMMPNWEDVTNRLSNMALSPTGKRVVVEARGEIFTIPADKGDVRN